MNENKILHVMILDKFLAPYIDFVDENFGRDNHHYVFITSEKYEYGLTPEHKVEFLYTDDDIFITLLDYMKMAKKIILHGLWRDKVDILLYFNQELLKKCYWVMWGGDFYFPEKQSWFRHKVIENMGYLINGTEGDISYIQNNYNAKGKYIEGVINYPSNIFYDSKIIISSKHRNETSTNILVGNSATPTNNHIEIFSKLEFFKTHNINIIIPLSYGDENYKNKIINLSKNIFKDKTTFLTEFLPYTEYLEILKNIDIAIFGHERQQATANIIQLLGFGKKVFLNKKSTLYDYFNKKDFKIFDFQNFNIDKLSDEALFKNQNLAKNIFSSKNLKSVLETYLT